MKVWCRLVCGLLTLRNLPIYEKSGTGPMPPISADEVDMTHEIGASFENDSPHDSEGLNIHIGSAMVKHGVVGSMHMMCI